MKNEQIAKDEATNVLLPESSGKVVYGGKEYEVKAMGVGQILQVLKVLRASEGAIRKRMQEDFQTAKDEKREYATFDMIISAVEVLTEGDLYKLIAILIGISEEDAKKGFKLADVLDLFMKVIEQEEVEKLFLGVVKLGNRIGGLSKAK